MTATQTKNGSRLVMVDEFRPILRDLTDVLCMGGGFHLSSAII